MIARALRKAAPRAAVIAAPRRGLGALRARLADLVEDRGETEVLQYGAMKWTVRDAKRYGDGLARGLAEFGVQAGDAVASLLSPDAPEQHCIELAAAVSGVVSCRVDAALGARGVRDALNEAEARVVVHDGSDEQLELLREAVPGFGGYASRTARAFFSPAVPSLKCFVSTALDMQPASHNYQHLLALDARPLELPPLADDAPLARVFGDGATQSWTHREAAEAGALPALAAVLHLRPTRFADRLLQRGIGFGIEALVAVHGLAGRHDRLHVLVKVL